MRARHIAAVLLFAFGTSFLVRRAQIMIPLLMEDPTNGVSQAGLTVYYLVLFSMLSLVSLAIAGPYEPDEFDDSDPM